MTTKPRTRWRAFALPKRGNAAAEYEDAFAGSPETGRFAVADGASESSFAQLWARELVEGFVRVVEGKTTGGWLSPLRKDWASKVDGLPLPWYAEEKRAQGAFATLVGLTVLQPNSEKGGMWRALAVGDSCLFQVREDRLVVSFPLKNAAEFNQQPPLVGSRGVADGGSPTNAKRERGRWQPGDLFFLATDALAQWFLQRHADDRKPWQSLLKRLTDPKDAALTTYVQSLRDCNEIRNDDVTLLALSL